MGFLTNKDRIRMQKVRDMMARGESPYSKIVEEKGNVDAGGLDKDRKERDMERAPYVSASRIRYTGRRRGGIVMVTSEDVEACGFNLKSPAPVYLEPVPLLHTRCTNCGVPTPNRFLTHAQGKPRKVLLLEEITTLDGHVEFKERINHTVDKLAYCPKCVSITIHPTGVDKDGNPVYLTVKFPESEG